MVRCGTWKMVGCALFRPSENCGGNYRTSTSPHLRVCPRPVLRQSTECSFFSRMPTAWPESVQVTCSFRESSPICLLQGLTFQKIEQRGGSAIAAIDFRHDRADLNTVHCVQRHDFQRQILRGDKRCGSDA